jgi:hypothetical protein
MNHPPTALVGFGTGAQQVRYALIMNDPRSALANNTWSLLGGRGRGSSFWTDRPASGPTGIAHSIEIHLEETDRLFAGHDLIKNL